jgi:spore germination protein KA
MPNNPLADPVLEAFSDSLAYNVGRLREMLRAEQNEDILVRRVEICGFPAALIFIDGMANMTILNENVLEPAMREGRYGGAPEERLDWLVREVITASGVSRVAQMDEAITAILTGGSVLLVEGSAAAAIIDAKGFSKRNVEQPINETTIVGPHEAFVESLRVNLTLLRRALPSPRFVAEPMNIGQGVKTHCALVYLDGVANEDILNEIRRRINSLNIDYIGSIGTLEQLIEDSPYAIVPQMAHTERPDRATSYLLSGMALLVLDGSPMVLGMPITVMHMLHTSDLTSMRFPYSTFKSLSLLMGLVITTLLPAIYVSLMSHHNEVIPLALMTSIHETQSRVPVPILYEMIFIGLGFDLINEAGQRMPNALTHGLGVVGALILGQAVVTADLVSPLIIVVGAVSGLGSLIVPEYGLSIGLRIMQATSILVAALGGFYGIILLFFLAGVELCCMTSMGVPLAWSMTPGRMHNPDNATRYPVWQQRIRFYLSQPGQLLRAQGRMRAWDQGQKGRK